MPKFVREDIDNLNAVLTVTIEKADYEPKFKEGLKKYQQQASFKGFRKGKTPMSFLKKMFGKQIIAEAVNEILQTQIGEALSDKETKYLGQPIPHKDQELIEFAVKTLEDYEFKFEIGKAPEFEVKGVDESISYEQYLIDVPAEDVEKDFEAARKRHGDRVAVEEDIEGNDMVKIAVKELDGDAIKEGGIESEFSVLVDRVDSESIKNDLLSKKLGDTLRFNINEVENNDSPNYAKKYFLQMSQEEIDEGKEIGEMFEGTIIEVMRVQLAEVDQAFFDKQFGEGKVTSEEEAKERIKEGISGFYKSQTEAVLFRNFQDTLLEENRPFIPLPDDFLKRWLVTASEENTMEMVEKDYERFADNLRWSLIKSQLSERFDVKVEEAEIEEQIRKQVTQYMGGYAMGDFLDQMVSRSMQDPKVLENATNEVLDDKLFEKIKEAVTIQENTVSVEEFEKIVTALRAENAPAEEEE